MKSISLFFKEFLVSVQISNIDLKSPNNLIVNEQKTIFESVISEEQPTYFKLKCLDFYIKECSIHK